MNSIFYSLQLSLEACKPMAYLRDANTIGAAINTMSLTIDKHCPEPIAVPQHLYKEVLLLLLLQLVADTLQSLLLSDFIRYSKEYCHFISKTLIFYRVDIQ